jgi:Tfp pilus assembly protein PilF
MSQVHRFTPEGLQVALAHFQAALEIEPHSALAHSGIANVLAFSSLLGAVRPRDAGPRAVRAAAQATELDPTLAQGFAATGFLAYQYEWDWPKAEEALRKAIEISPNNADAHTTFALLLSTLGRREESNRLMARALELDPLNLNLRHVHGVRLLWQGDDEQAVAQLEDVVARAPQMQMSHLTLWAAYNRLQAYDAALKSATNAWSIIPDRQMQEALVQGRRDDGYRGAMKQGADVLAKRFAVSYVPPNIISLMYDFAAETEKAFEWIDQGIAQREPAVSYLNRKPYSIRIRGNPRFAALLQKLQLPLDGKK